MRICSGVHQRPATHGNLAGTDRIPSGGNCVAPGRLQELGAQHRVRILPGALTLALASRAPPRLSWSTTFKRGLTVVRGLGNFVFMKNRLVPVKSWKPVFKRRNSATLKKGHSIQVNINPTLQKCEHSPVVVKKTQIVFPRRRANKLPGPPLW